MVRQELPLRYGYSLTCTRFTLTYADLATATAATPASVTLADALGNLFSVAQGGLVFGIRVKHDVKAAAPALTALTMTIGQVGDTTNNTFFVATPYNLFAAVADNTVQETALFKAGQDAAFNINVTFTGDGTYNLSTLTAMQVHIDIFVAQFGPINTQANAPSVTP
jgi:hypothetical protein